MMSSCVPLTHRFRNKRHASWLYNAQPSPNFSLPLMDCSAAGLMEITLLQVHSQALGEWLPDLWGCQVAFFHVESKRAKWKEFIKPGHVILKSIHLSPSKHNQNAERLGARYHDWNQTQRSTFISVLCSEEQEAPCCDSVSENQGCDHLHLMPRI